MNVNSLRPKFNCNLWSPGCQRLREAIIHRDEFYKLPLPRPDQGAETFQYSLKYPERHRYKDIFPFEKNRFRIDSDPDFYFNASYTLNGKGIASQGPLENEKEQFWKMVWHSNTPVILMLANLIENGIEKCSQYWPTETPLSFESDTFSVTLDSTSQEKDGIIRRTFILEKDGQKKIIPQYHVTCWGDKGTISEELLAEIIHKVDTLKSLNPSSPILAHCNAGVGRTGTFFAAFEGYQELKQNPKNDPNVFEIVSKLRQERYGMVQTERQYAQIYDTLKFLKNNS